MGKRKAVKNRAASENEPNNTRLPTRGFKFRFVVDIFFIITVNGVGLILSSCSKMTQHTEEYQALGAMTIQSKNLYLRCVEFICRLCSS